MNRALAGQTPTNFDDVETDMPTTEEYIAWSETIGRGHRRNHQLFLEVAGAACRWHRDATPGASTIPELANADHYWLGRLIGFMVQSTSSGGRYFDSIDRRLGDLASASLSILSSGLGAAPWIAVCSAWDLLKRTTRAVGLEPPGGGPTASAPSSAQVAWGTAGWGHAMVLDMPFAREARPYFRMGELEGRVMIPPLPR